MNEQFYNTNLLYYVLPDPVHKALAVFAAHGYRAYVVGGAVRDIMRGVPLHDWDIATETPPELTKHLFSSFPTYDTGIKHGTVTVNIDGEFIEITTFRTDGEYKDSRHPENVTFTSSLEEDLMRRDFTINAMALNVCLDLSDPFRGMEDLSNNLIRAVGDPVKRFTEDALRIMRAFRFSATLLYQIEEKTLEAAAMCAHRLDYIAKERINEEWKKLLTARFCSKTLLTMKEQGVLSIIFPGLELTERQLTSLEELEPLYILRSAYFFKNCPIVDIEKAASRINFTKNELSEVKSIIKAYRDIVNNPSQNLRRYCYLNGKSALYGATLAEHDFLVPASILPEVKGVFDDKSMIWSRKDLAVNGKDILARYDIPKKELGELTEKLVMLVVDKKIPNDKNSLLAAVAELI